MVIGEYTIEVKLRDKKVSVSELRRTGSTPAVVYGKETESIAVQTDAKILTKLYHEAGESSLVQLKLDDTERLILFKEPQYDPVTSEIIHMDLYQIKLGEKIKAEVQLVFEGESMAVEQEGGILITNKDKVEIESLPRDLPKEIIVDISVLEKIEDSLSIKDLKVPEGVEILDDPEDSVVVVTPQRTEKVEPVVSETTAVEGVEIEGEKVEGEDSEAPAEGKGSVEATGDKPIVESQDAKDK